MVNQPVLDRSAVSLADIRYLITYHDAFFAPDDPRLDEAHIHSCYEFYLNLSGSVSFLVNNHLYAIQSGDVIVTRPGDVHLCVFNDACVHEHFCLWISCAERSPFGEFLESAFTHNHYSFGQRSQLADLFRLLLRQEGPSLPSTAALLQLLTFLKDRGERQSEISRSVMPPEMQIIVDDINEHFAEIHHMNDILARHYISQATLNRWFRKYIRLSPKEFLEARKLSFAKSLLLNGASVTDACMQSGFNDPSYFIAVFKKRFGETPFRYKNRLFCADV